MALGILPIGQRIKPMVNLFFLHSLLAGRAWFGAFRICDALAIRLPEEDLVVNRFWESGSFSDLSPGFLGDAVRLWLSGGPVERE